MIRGRGGGRGCLCVHVVVVCVCVVNCLFGPLGVTCLCDFVVAVARFSSTPVPVLTAADLAAAGEWASLDPVPLFSLVLAHLVRLALPHALPAEQVSTYWPLRVPDWSCRCEGGGLCWRWRRCWLRMRMVPLCVLHGVGCMGVSVCLCVCV